MNDIDLTSRSFAEEPQTFFRGGNAPYQLDYLFSDQLTASRVADTSVDQDVVVELGLSDHAPVIATVDV